MFFPAPQVNVCNGRIKVEILDAQGFGFELEVEFFNGFNYF